MAGLYSNIKHSLKRAIRTSQNWQRVRHEDSADSLDEAPVDGLTSPPTCHFLYLLTKFVIEGGGNVSFYNEVSSPKVGF